MTLLPHLINGVALGLLFALIALGFMLVVSLMETINLAHGSFFALGMYIALLVIAPTGEFAGAWLGSWKALPVVWRYGIALLIAPLVVGLVGMVLEVALRRDRKSVV